MQREIKFRGKSAESDNWVTGDLVHNAPNAFSRLVTIAIKPDGCYPIEVLPESVGQYTGLKDRNGKEIYEGDIVIGGGCLSPIDVRWNIKGRWSFGKSNLDFTQSTILSLQIIGNTIDNPELIKP